MRLPILLGLALMLPLAAAQDPTVNESDMDAEAPPPDDAYLYEDEAADPTLEEGDLDASVPPPDDAWLAQEEASVASADGAAPTGDAMRSPGPAFVLVLAALAAVALALRR